MSDSEYTADIDLSEMVDDSEQYKSSAMQDSSPTEADCSATESELNTSEITPNSEKKTPQLKADVIKNTRLPMARIKSIMKMDPDVHLINNDALFLVTKATELFLETIAKETYTYTANRKRKTISKKDLDYVINLVDCLCFLEGALDF